MSDAKSIFFGINQSPEKNNESKYRLLDQTDKILVQPNINFNSSDVKPTSVYQNIPCNSFIAQKQLNGVNQTETSAPANNDNLNQFNSNDNDDDDDDDEESSASTKTGNDLDTFDGQPTSEDKPTQAVYMATTVPQNIKGNNIMGRHTPTRNSLRHSRMLVVNKNFKAPSDNTKNPLNLRCPRLIKTVLILQIVFGSVLTCLGVWILLWAPTTRTRDNPYWSGIALTLSGILGFMLLEFKRIPRNKFREKCFLLLKINTTILFICAFICALAAFLCAAIHFSNLSSAEKDCMPENIFVQSSSCICIFGTNNRNNHAQVSNTNRAELSKSNLEFFYRDLNCDEVEGVWRWFMLASTIMNIFGVISTLLFIVSSFYWKKKTKVYSNVRTNLY